MSGSGCSGLKLCECNHCCRRFKDAGALKRHKPGASARCRRDAGFLRRRALEGTGLHRLAQAAADSALPEAVVVSSDEEGNEGAEGPGFHNASQDSISRSLQQEASKSSFLQSLGAGSASHNLMSEHTGPFLSLSPPYLEAGSSMMTDDEFTEIDALVNHLETEDGAAADDAALNLTHSPPGSSRQALTPICMPNGFPSGPLASGGSQTINSPPLTRKFPLTGSWLELDAASVLSKALEAAKGKAVHIRLQKIHAALPNSKSQISKPAALTFSKKGTGGKLVNNSAEATIDEGESGFIASHFHERLPEELSWAEKIIEKNPSWDAPAFLPAIEKYIPLLVNEACDIEHMPPTVVQKLIPRGLALKHQHIKVPPQISQPAQQAAAHYPPHPFMPYPSFQLPMYGLIARVAWASPMGAHS
ncbi:hypothetical protein WJX84_005255 [Apatococcus fuscideae]|uniref:C2H2-type domain-containing protein n=1 Tax=Apatococcus fuscideae TaxID=2026836 RepID=A0AAW1SBL9_9CHLO